MHIHPSALETYLESYFTLPGQTILLVDTEIERWQDYAVNGGTEETPLASLQALKTEGIVEFNQYAQRSIDDERLFEALYSKMLLQYINVQKERNPTKASFISEKDFVHLELERIDGEASFCKQLTEDSKYYHQLKRWIEFLKQRHLSLGTLPVTKADGEQESTVLPSKSEARKKLLLMRELGVLDLLVNKLSKEGNGNLNDTDLSRLISIMVGENPETIAKDLMLVHHNIPGSKDRPINQGSVKKIQAILSEFGMQVQNLPIILDRVKK